MPQPDGGTMTPVAGLAERVARGIRYAFTGKADWFGPGAPVAPSAPEQVAGRQFQMPISYNTLIQSKVEGVSFSQLRMLADTCDIIRLLIEIRKDQICALDWSVQEKGTLTSRGRAPAMRANDPTAQRLMDFLVSPDKDHSFETWLRYLLEDMFVIDAPTLYIQRTKGGGVYALRPIDGATIKRIIDPHGWVPMPPLPAFQQILQGTAAIDYTTDELIYSPRNMRTNRLYGLSHVEQIIVTAKTWLARQAYNLEYYNTGTTPEGFLSASKDWGVQQIAEYQELFDLQLSGQLGERRKLKITPNDSKFTETKEPAFKNSYDEWLARIACFCFSVPPTAFVNEMNRATAGTQNISSLETGLAPLRVWVERLVTGIIQKHLDGTGYEFTFRDKEAEDPLERANIDQIYLASGVLVANEVRTDLGLAPLAEPAKPVVAPSDVPPSPEHGADAPNPRTAVNIKHAHGDLKKVAPETPREKKLAGVFAMTLAEVRDAVIRQWRALTGQTVTTADAEAFANAADLSGFSLAWDDYSGELVATAADGSKQALLRVKATEPNAVPDNMLDVRDPRAVEWAEQHAAEMLTSDGAGGELVDATRNMIKQTIVDGIKSKLSREQLAESLRIAHAFSHERADLIAVTEIGNATSGGLYAGYQLAGMQEKRWLLSNDDNVCPVCVANAAQGYIPMNDAFQSGDMQPLAHPHCQCDLAARLKPKED
jgi:hypothetical protein